MPCASVGRPPEQLRRGTGRSARPAGDRSAGAGRVATPASTLRAECPRLGSARRGSRPARSAKSLLEPRVVAYGGEVIVSARVLAEPREQVNGPSKVGERLVAGVARERRETRVVVIETRVVRHVLEGTADRFERVGVSLFAVGRHGLSVERPRLTPVDPLVRLAGCGADNEDGSVPGRLPPRLRPDEHERPGGRVERLAVDLEGRLPVEHDVQLLLARPGLVVLTDQRAVLAGRVGVDSECVDPEVLAHRNISAAPPDFVTSRVAKVEWAVRRNDPDDLANR